MSRALELHPYIVDVLMRDLAGHDRSPSAYFVYLWLWRHSRGRGHETIGASLQTIAAGTGLSKSSVQNGARHLQRRQLISASRAGATEAPVYTGHEPWRRGAIG
jgi:hypothetical protein